MKNKKSHKPRYLILWITILGSIITSIAQSPSIPFSQPACQGLEPKKVQEAVTLFKNLPESYSLIIVRNGKLVSENYFHDSLAEEPHHIRSATKSIMSILIGIAIDKGFITSVDEPLYNYFPNNPNLKSITIQHLLDMRSGFAWNEHRGDLLTWQNHPTPNQFLFNKVNHHPAGDKFVYNSAAVHLLGHILEESSGLKPYEFAKKFLFQPLKIDNIKWMKLADGFVNGGYGMEIKPLDLAKIGLLFANNGRWENKQIISANWIEHSLQKNVDFQKDFGSLNNSGYGNLWWTGMKNNHEVYFALGYGGQFLAIIPDLDIVIVTTQQWSLSDNSIQRENYITNVIALIIEANLNPENC